MRINIIYNVYNIYIYIYIHNVNNIQYMCIHVSIIYSRQLFVDMYAFMSCTGSGGPPALRMHNVNNNDNDNSHN